MFLVLAALTMTVGVLLSLIAARTGGELFRALRPPVLRTPDTFRILLSPGTYVVYERTGDAPWLLGDASYTLDTGTEVDEVFVLAQSGENPVVRPTKRGQTRTRSDKARPREPGAGRTFYGARSTFVGAVEFDVDRRQLYDVTVKSGVEVMISKPGARGIRAWVTLIGTALPASLLILASIVSVRHGIRHLRTRA